ncbi:hypothetical protein SNEBB_001482 [Seison nebaliae]|nr:hypothetical protein SNEBB_001482 [Seison nebaliae]
MYFTSQSSKDDNENDKIKLSKRISEEWKKFVMDVLLPDAIKKRSSSINSLSYHSIKSDNQQDQQKQHVHNQHTYTSYLPEELERRRWMKDNYGRRLATTQNYVELRQMILSHEYIMFRSLNWRLMLNLLPSIEVPHFDNVPSVLMMYQEEWEKEFGRRRELLDPNGLGEHLENDSHPLDNNSPFWAHYHNRNKLNEQLLRDLKRTFPEYDWFQQPSIIDTLQKILIRYCYNTFCRNCEDDEKSKERTADDEPMNLYLNFYRQGFHEILSLIYHDFHVEYEQINRLLPFIKKNFCMSDKTEKEMFKLFKYCYRPSFLTIDVYDFFTVLVSKLSIWYNYSISSNKNNNNNNQKKKQMNEHRLPTTKYRSSDTSTQRFNNIFKYILQRRNLCSAELMTKYDIDFSIFAYRWCRILFIYEFKKISHISLLWDLIFAYDSSDDLILTDIVIVALLEKIINDILLQHNLDDEDYDLYRSHILIGLSKTPAFKYEIDEEFFLFLSNLLLIGEPENLQLIQQIEQMKRNVQRALEEHHTKLDEEMRSEYLKKKKRLKLEREKLNETNFDNKQICEQPKSIEIPDNYWLYRRCDEKKHEYYRKGDEYFKKILMKKDLMINHHPHLIGDDKESFVKVSPNLHDKNWNIQKGLTLNTEIDTGIPSSFLNNYFEF